MPYSPQPATGIRNPEELRQWLEDELRNIALAINEMQVIDLRPIFREPDRIRDGMLIFADGVSFNPGAGAGTYERRGGAWVKL
jgi:hypothetical protein